jgi:hypothetical protein
MGGGRGTIRIGCGSADAEGRLDPGIDLARHAQLDYLVLDTLSERTLPAAQMRKRLDPSAGYDTRAPRIFSEMLAACLDSGTTMVGNMGGANPEAAFAHASAASAEAGHRGLRIGLVLGDDVLDAVLQLDPRLMQTGDPLSQVTGEVVSANAYIGADPVVQALAQGARVVIGGRIADPSLYLGPLRYEFGWAESDWPMLGAGQMVGHLLECGIHATGGNMADPPYRIIPGLDDLGAPMGEVDPTGDWIMTKLLSSGGVVDVLNCKAQLFHEIHDPANYLTPDVTADFSNVSFEQIDTNRVRCRGASGTARPDQLKVLIGVMEGYIGEGEITFAGPGALSRARLAQEIIQKRMQRDSPLLDEVRFDFIGVNSAFGAAAPEVTHEPSEIRFRMAGRTKDRIAAEWITQEIQGLFFGPASGGGMRRDVREVLGVYSTLIPRDAVSLEVHVEEV